MDSQLFYWAAPIIFFVASLFLSIRLKFFSRTPISGRIPFIFGTILLLVSLVWFSVMNLSAYNDWFVPSAYAVISYFHFALFIIGLLLATIGLVLFADFWDVKKDDIRYQEQRMALLADLQKDAREPYHLMELFNISLKEIVSHLDQTVGAVFLANRNQRRIILTASAGLTKQETALFEQYPIGQNIITQSIELGDPLISSLFEFVDQSNKKTESRFQSTLVLPLISGSEKIGAIVLLSEEKQQFSSAEIRFLSPISEWLAEKVKSTRLTKELSIAEDENNSLRKLQTDLNHRLLSTAISMTSTEAVVSFCRSLVGLLESRSVHLFGLKQGALQFYGGSEPLLDLSENYKTALLDALDRKKPLILNQEATGEDGRSFITRSTLVVPVAREEAQDALMLVRDSRPFRVNDNDLKNIEIYAHLGRLTLRQQEMTDLHLARRKGLEKIIDLLRVEPSVTFENDPNFFSTHMSRTLPKNSLALTFVRQPNGIFKNVGDSNIDSSLNDEFRILSGEGFIGNMSARSETAFLSGKVKIENAVNTFEEHNRTLFYQLFGERGIPSFAAACPIYNLHGLVGCSLFFMFEMHEEEIGEWQKLLTLASGLYSVRLTINQLTSKKNEVVPDSSTDRTQLGSTVNRLNNHLSVIIGNAELIAVREDISGEVRNQFQIIINETEQAARFLKDALGKFSETDSEKIKDVKESIPELIDRQLSKVLISDNLYLLSGSPREINKIYKDSAVVALDHQVFENFFDEAVNRFAAAVPEDDSISIVTYQKDNYFYLDISKHHKNFPPVDNVASISNYYTISEAIRIRPTDRFLTHLANEHCFYAFDRLSTSPSYISFKMPLEPVASLIPKKESGLRILAIDDQAVILDLISAMCQTLGYEVTTADNGEKGYNLAINEDFDIILTDLAMPGLSGIEVAREVRKKGIKTPIILVTGWEVDLSEEKLHQAGITSILYKPFRIEQLTELITSFVSPGNIS